MRIGEADFQIKIAWALAEDVPPTLGRADVSDKFKVIFKQKEKNTEFVIGE